jgi:parallel beta-helix repeat protein
MKRGRAAAVLIGVWLLGAGAPRAADAPPVLRVRAGESIAAALASAPEGSVIEVEPGVYREALVVDTPGITLLGIVRGAERPVLDGGGEKNDGVIASGSPFAMSGFRIQHYRGNGVTTQGVAGVTLDDLIVDDTGLYGLYPVNSSDIRITHCTATRIRDAAIYVGESKRALVAGNEVHDNVAGIEIENTNDAEVRDNLAHHNTTGILVFVLPQKLQKEGRRTLVTRNWVIDNDTRNFGDPESVVGQLPHGGGILVMGADDTRVEGNWVKGNDSFGIAVIRLPEPQAQRDPELEPMSDRTQVTGNLVVENGGAPHPQITTNFGGGSDLAWDGTGTGNCIDLHPGAVVRGAPAPRCRETAAPWQEGAPSADAHPLPEPPAPAILPAPPAPPAPAAPTTVESSPGAQPAPPPPAPAPAQPPADGAAPTSGTQVRIHGMRFEPHHLTVSKGATVEWVNEDALPHTVTSSSGMTILRAPLDSPFMLKGDRFAHTFDSPGRYEYLCLPHMDQAPMREASVTVVE